MPVFGDILPKLDRLSQDCERLETHRQLSREAFLANPTVQGDTCYLLLTTMQGALNVGDALLKALGLSRPAEEIGLFALLVEEEVLTEACVAQLTAMWGLCHLLSEQYEEIDPQWIYQTLQVNLAGLDQFVQYTRTFINDWQEGRRGQSLAKSS